MAETRIGISGWTYKPWRGTFYPKDLTQNQELAYASRALNSIEINGTFYSLQKPASFEKWYDETPDDFVFAVKAGRYITHIKRLAGVESALANFFASGLLLLKEKLGPILWQLPPSFQFDADRLEAFFKLLPRDTKAAARFAAGHEAWMKKRAHVITDAKRPIRHAIEVRHESFRTPEFIALLRKHKIALVIADTAGKWPFMEDITADFIYARLHGDEELYASGYSDSALDAWAKKFKSWRSGKQPKVSDRASTKPASKRTSRDVFVYFDNDVKVRSPFDAAVLARRLGVKWGEKSIELPDLSKVNEKPREQWPGVQPKKATRKRRASRVSPST